MQVTYRAWEREDIPKIAQLEKEIFSDAWTEEMLSLAYDRPDFLGLVAFANDTLIGYVCGSVLFEQADLMIIAVKDGYRKLGLGGTMLDSFLSKAQALGAEQVFLEARQSNTPALRLYQSRGFTQTRIRKRYYADGEDAVEMVKTL